MYCIFRMSSGYRVPYTSKKNFLSYTERSVCIRTCTLMCMHVFVRLRACVNPCMCVRLWAKGCRDVRLRRQVKEAECVPPIDEGLNSPSLHASLESS